jgi:hypothetical protein
MNNENERPTVPEDYRENLRDPPPSVVDTPPVHG